MDLEPTPNVCDYPARRVDKSKKKVEKAIDFQTPRSHVVGSGARSLVTARTPQ